MNSSTESSSSLTDKLLAKSSKQQTSTPPKSKTKIDVVKTSSYFGKHENGGAQQETTEKRALNLRKRKIASYANLDDDEAIDQSSVKKKPNVTSGKFSNPKTEETYSSIRGGEMVNVKNPLEKKTDAKTKIISKRAVKKKVTAAKSDSGESESDSREINSVKKKAKINLEKFRNEKTTQSETVKTTKSKKLLEKKMTTKTKTVSSRTTVNAKTASSESESDFERLDGQSSSSVKKKPKIINSEKLCNEKVKTTKVKKPVEKKLNAKTVAKRIVNKKIIETKTTALSESESDWEEVENMPSTSTAHAHETNKVSDPIEITVQPPKGKEKVDMEKMIKRAIAKYKKDTREYMHKMHLLAFIAHGVFLSKISNNRLVQSVALSMVPIGFCNLKKSNEFTLDLLKRFVKWFKSAYVVQYKIDFEDFPSDIRTDLSEKIAAKTVDNYRELVLIFVATVRSLSLDARVVFCVQPYPLKDDSSQPNDPNPKSLTNADEKNVTVKDKKLENGKKRKAKNGPEAVDKVERGKMKLVYNHWAEVYLEASEKWISINFVTGSVDEPHSLQETCAQPISYIFAFDSENTLKDVTSRYCKNFTSPAVRRLRLGKDEWYEKTLKLFKTRRRLRERLEEMELKAKLSEMPFPTTVSEFKNHPLYVLKRDLLKFEGIYPADTKPLGCIRNEPIYPRSAVHCLHSKQTWRKEARMVREGEEAVKIVKSRPKQGVPKEEQTDRPLPLFGIWQTEPYVAPPAVDGIVPRNEYGNVELFKMSMLPQGTVYLPHPGMLQVAKKLNIDCAPAMVGWDFHAGGSHPVLDGFVVCEEFSETLIAAWDQEQAIIAEREILRKSKRAILNWKKLIRGLLLREKVRKKFAYHDKKASIDQAADSGALSVESTPGCSSTSWPQCRMGEFTFKKDSDD